MFTIENFLSQEVVQKIGWMLLHFIWQATAVALVLAVLQRLLRRFSANLRYIAACIALLTIVALPIITMQFINVSSPSFPAAITPVTETATIQIESAVEIPYGRQLEMNNNFRAEPVVTKSGINWKQRVINYIEPKLPYIVTVWLLGVFALSIWHLGGWAQLQKLRKKMVKQVDTSLYDKLNILAKKLGVNQAVELLESALVQIPTVVGWIRPVILLPASAMTGLTAEQLEAILAHELAHIKRYDYLVNMLQTVVEILGFYHPAVWWISHKIRSERENCCDDLAVAVCGDRINYAKALTSMEEIRGKSELAVAATGGNLFSRIRRLIGKDSNEKTFSWIPAAAVILLLIALIIPTTLALTSSRNEDPNNTKIEKMLIDGFRENRDRFKCGILAWTRTTLDDGFSGGTDKYETKGSFQLWWDGEKITTRYVNEQRYTGERGSGIEAVTGGNIYDGGALSRKPKYSLYENWFEQIIRWTGSASLDKDIAQTKVLENTQLDWSIIESEEEKQIKMTFKSLDDVIYSIRYFDISRGFNQIRYETYNAQGQLRSLQTRKLQQIGDGWFPVEVDMKSFDTNDGKVTLNNHFSLDLSRCSFNDPDILPEGIFDFSTVKEHEQLNEILEKYLKGSNDYDDNMKKACDSVYNYITAVMAKQDEKATEYAHPESSIARTDDNDQTREILKGQQVQLIAVYADDWNALVTSSVILGDHGRIGPMIFHLRREILDQKVHWLIDDIDLETIDSVEEEFDRFLERNTEAKKLMLEEPISINTQTGQSENDSEKQAEQTHKKLERIRRSFDNQRAMFQNMRFTAIRTQPHFEAEFDRNSNQLQRITNIDGKQKITEQSYQINKTGKFLFSYQEFVKDSSTGQTIQENWPDHISFNGKIYQHLLPGEVKLAVIFTPEQPFDSSGPMIKPTFYMDHLFNNDILKLLSNPNNITISELDNGLWHLTYKNSDTQSNEFFDIDFDPAKEYMITKIQGKWGVQTNYTKEIEYSRNEQGFYYPVKGSLTISGDEPSTIQITDFQLNGPEGDYTLDIPDGTSVTDYSRNTEQPVKYTYRKQEESEPNTVQMQRMLSVENLKQLGLAVIMYAHDHDSKMPESLDILKPYLADEKVFQWVMENVEYLGEGSITRPNTAQTPIAFDYKLQDSNGTNILFMDGHVEFASLEKFRDFIPDKTSVQIEMRLLSVNEEFLEDINTNLNLNLESATVLDNLQTASLLQTTQEDKDIKLLAAPRVVVFNNETAKFSAVTEVPYISGYTEPKSTDEEASPIVKFENAGIVLTCTPNIESDNQSVTVQYELIYSQVDGYVEHLYNGKYKGKNPVISRKIFEGTALIPDGKTLLFDGGEAYPEQDDNLDPPEEKMKLLILIKPTIAPLETLTDESMNSEPRDTATIKTDPSNIMRVYDITDLITSKIPRDASGGMMGGMMGGMGSGYVGGMMGGMGSGYGGGMMGGYSGSMIGGPVSIASIEAAQKIALLIQETIEPDSWNINNEKAEGVISPYPAARPRKLTVFNTPEVHQEIKKLLESLRKVIYSPQIAIELRYLLADEEFLNEVKDSLGIELSSETFLDDKQVESLLRASQKNQDVKLLVLPRVTILNNETAHFSSGPNFFPNPSRPNIPLQVPPTSPNISCQIKPLVSDDKQNIDVVFAQVMFGQGDIFFNSGTQAPLESLDTVKNKSIPDRKTFAFPCAMSQPSSQDKKKVLIAFLKPTIISPVEAEDNIPGEEGSGLMMGGSMMDSGFGTPPAKTSDESGKQILIETQIIQVSDEFLESIGLDANSLQNSDTWSKYRIDNSNDPKSFVIDKLISDLIQKAIEEHPDCRIISQPKIAIKDGKLGTIEIVTEEYFITTSNTIALYSKQKLPYTRSDLTKIKAGTFINYTPQITDENNILLDFDINVKDFVNPIDFHPGDDPNQFVETIFEKSSDILIPDNHSLLILGGKISQTSSGESKVPILGDLPLLNRLFSNRYKITDEFTPLILIKPTIVSPNE